MAAQVDGDVGLAICSVKVERHHTFVVCSRPWLVANYYSPRPLTMPLSPFFGRLPLSGAKECTAAQQRTG